MEANRIAGKLARTRVAVALGILTLVLAGCGGGGASNVMRLQDSIKQWVTAYLQQEPGVPAAITGVQCGALQNGQTATCTLTAQGGLYGGTYVVTGTVIVAGNKWTYTPTSGGHSFPGVIGRAPPTSGLASSSTAGG